MSTSHETSGSRTTRDPESTPREHFPWLPLLALALAGFVCIMTETLPVGLLPQIADDLGVSESVAGQWVSVYAGGTVITVLPAIALTRGIRRKPLLLIGAAGFLLANAATALAPTYEVALIARAVAGGFSGLVWGILAGYARRLVPSSLAGRALAVAMVGTPLALSLGTPAGTWMGGIFGWRWTFAAMSMVALCLVVWIVLGVPDRPGQARTEQTAVWRVAAIPGVAPVLATTFAWLLAHNLLYTYIAPYISWLDVGTRTDAVLMAFGCAALIGIWLTGRLVDAMLRRLVLGSLAAFALSGLTLALGGHSSVLFWAAVALWGLTFGGAATQLTTAATDSATGAVDIVTALMVVAFNLAIFGGGAVGGLMLQTWGPGSFPWAVVLLATLGLIVAAIARHRSFTPGPRD
ncbi:MFS transporter [Rhodococcus sp. 15-1154-1]|nr:MFS transporter [Rhodococcus sp. 15-1154-1]OZF07776.1 MFS transporter [Rhodococcus sp. 15-1154-1]